MFLYELNSWGFESSWNQRVISNDTYYPIIRETFQTILTNYYKENHSETENSFQTILPNYYQRNHCNQFLQIIIREIILNNSHKLFSREIIPNKTYKLLSEKSFQTILTNYYQRNNSTQFLQTTTREITVNNTYKLSSENHFKWYLLYYHQRNISKNTYKLLQGKPFRNRELISNNSYKLLSEKSMQPILTNHN